MPNFEKLLMAVTRNGALQPTHLRGWAKALEDHQRYSGVNVVVRYSENDIVAWLREIADTLEEIYAEVTEKYKEDDRGKTTG